MGNMDSHRAVEEAVNSMEMEGFHPTEEDKRLAYLCVTGQISYEEVLRSVME
ncbi:MAG: antitoxin VbhA family protein [Candidatus Methanomethylophilaceae archaeon]|nr:antitoxin VbhA family protein [Candidatus Methanomethylophilaceae archaeon]